MILQLNITIITNSPERELPKRTNSKNNFTEYGKELRQEQQERYLKLYPLGSKVTLTDESVGVVVEVQFDGLLLDFPDEPLIQGKTVRKFAVWSMIHNSIQE